MIKWLLVACVVLSALLLWRVAAAAKRNLPRIGEPAPEFELPDPHGKTRSLAAFRGRWLVLYFFPRADTPA